MLWILRPGPDEYVGRPFSDFLDDVRDLKARECLERPVVDEESGEIVDVARFEDGLAPVDSELDYSEWSGCHALVVDEAGAYRHWRPPVWHRQVAKNLSVHPRTLRRWRERHQGELPSMDAWHNGAGMMSLEDAERRLDLHRRTLHRWRESGRITPDEMLRLPGGHWRIAVHAVERLANQSRVSRRNLRSPS